MSDFDDLMSSLGVKPIKKEKKEKNAPYHRDKEVSNLEEVKAILPEDYTMEGLLKEKENSKNKSEIYSANKKSNKKSKKEDFSNSFEEALKLYNPQIEEDNLSSNHSVSKKIFHERFSTIEEEDIMYTIDLHGKTLDNAIALVKDKLVWCYREKFDNILIITGKGNHSDNGPILKIGIKNLLINMANLVELIEYAPKVLGGEGAYIVKIRL